MNIKIEYDDKLARKYYGKNTNPDKAHKNGYRLGVRDTLEKLEAIMFEREAEAYKHGLIDGSIEVVNNTCEICHAYPMTTNCNNADCDK